MNTEGTSGHDRPFKDCTTGLTVFGILQVLLGGLWVVLALFMIMGMLASRALEAPGAPMDARMMVLALLLYFLLAAWFITMGVGSIMTRRWARALVLVSSSIWLVCGLIGLVMVVAIIPGMFGQMGEAGQLPPGMVVVMVVVATVFMVFFYVLIPGALVLFYGNRNVKATCEFKDPQVRWTDRCPLPVLALSLILGGWAVSMLMMGSYGWVIPFFGRIVSGLPGAVLCLVAAAAFGFSAWGAYRLNMTAWWGAVILIVAWTASLAVTFTQVSFSDYMQAYYEQMNLPAQQMDMMKQFLTPQMSGMGWVSLIWFVGFLGYLLYIKRYFKTSTT